MPHEDRIIPVTVTFGDLPSVQEVVSWVDIRDLTELGFEIVTPLFSLRKILDGRTVLFRNFPSREKLDAYQVEFAGNDPARMITEIKDITLHYNPVGVQNTIDRLIEFHEAEIPPGNGGGSTLPPPGGDPPDIPVIPPPVEFLPADIFTQSFSVLDYRETPEGKTLFVQIQYTKVKEFEISNVTAHIVVTSPIHGTHLTESKDLQVGGATQFGVSFNIPDVPIGQPELNIQAFLFASNVPVAKSINIEAILNEHVDLPPPQDGTPSPGQPPARRKSSMLDGIILASTGLYFALGNVKK